ncbi:MAG: hypothetical protein QN152_07490 [Armatimonadota bacterium]|nr:hypothetical protein [Armatimonadota bacterium]MDR7426392.1 hypothetical protein [Armatimonadota bacterium]MDR7469523.1 hypothetical protein [Armatimonadota bacterium]MDR7473469.1 hypothetical protein [Armatimonadota bacterium]MDR7539357.1 hypothetical protein [Armatimonadota bacterium]
MRRALLTLVLVILLGTPGRAAALTVVVDPSRLGLLEARQAAVLAPEGYEVTYLLRPPGEQRFTLACWACLDAEFVEVVLTLAGADLVEARTRRPADAAALVIRPGPGGAAAFWDVYLGSERVPPPPAPEEVARRQAAAAPLLDRAREALGLVGFTGGPARIALQLRQGADLILRADEADGSTVYTLAALATPDLAESLEVARSAERWRLEVQPDLLAITWETFGQPANRTRLLRLSVDGWGEGTVETVTFPGGSRVLQPLARDQAEEILRGGLQELVRARHRFALGLGRDLSAYRLP